MPSNPLVSSLEATRGFLSRSVYIEALDSDRFVVGRPPIFYTVSQHHHIGTHNILYIPLSIKNFATSVCLCPYSHNQHCELFLGILFSYLDHNLPRQLINRHLLILQS